MRPLFHTQRCERSRLLAAPGPDFTLQEIEFNGERRHIISRNPLLFDDDGDVIDVDEDDDIEDQDIAPIEDDPYGTIKIEGIVTTSLSATQC
jgi:hypothetical protein